MRRSHILAAGLTVFVMAGCGQGPQDEEDGINDPFLVDGKADTAGIAENSPEAIGCLAVANKLSQTDLRKKVGLASNAASAIVAVRLGDDEAPGTADDVKFGTLKQLDDVPYVGPVAFSKLLTYARANGYVPPVGMDPPRMDTCPVPTGEFTVDSPTTSSGYYAAVLQVPATGAPRIFATEIGGGGKAILQLSRKAPKSWETTPILSAFSTSMAVTHGADPCLAYLYDYNWTLRLECASLSGRTIAPNAGGSLAMGHFGAAKQVIYSGANSSLYWVEVNPTAGTPEAIDKSPSGFGTSAMQVDASGRPHVVYAVHDRNGVPQNIRTIRYAVRREGVWTKETIDTDILPSGTSLADGVSLSLVLVSGQPVIAYSHGSTRSLRFARRGVNGWTTKTLSVPPAGFPDDSVGQSVALSVDCMDRLHVVFQRSFSTDPWPKNNLFRAIIADDKLTAVAAMPIGPETGTLSRDPYGLSFHVAADGRQTVAARIAGNLGSRIYFAHR